MKYDVIIAGGGLAGLMCGIALQREGRRVAIISSGKSALHFSSGSLELWNGAGGSLEKIAEEKPTHPYAIVGTEHLERYSNLTKDIFAAAGVTLTGDYGCNHLRLSPIGAMRPAWLTVNGFYTVTNEDELPKGKVVVVGIEGFLDFYPEYVADGLRLKGVECEVAAVTLPALEVLRESATEMRGVNISRALRGDVVEQLAERVNAVSAGAELVLLPAVFGLGDEDALERVAARVSCQVKVVPTASASVVGVKMQRQLTEYFTLLGGTFLPGDKVKSYRVEQGLIAGVCTHNHGDVEFRADSFVLATGSFFGRGLVANPDGVYEPIFGADVDYDADRAEWCSKSILDTQPFQRYGVKVDSHLRVSIESTTIDNLYAAGAVVGGADAVKEGCGAGVVVSTALMVAEEILGRTLCETNVK
ncbi:MAG: anaerobic glycerol-3-phosphate dehydrogenase subunit B [Tidjanibacter sp.]|nr:anaerobic glycerol-3-phosphate dehydrogenase subunit B [Tidjanibacter sp.]